MTHKVPQHANELMTIDETGEEGIARLSPRMHGHINILGEHTFTLPEDIMNGEVRTSKFLNLTTDTSYYPERHSLITDLYC